VKFEKARLGAGLFQLEEFSIPPIRKRPRMDGAQTLEVAE
jgi:hypothetical protein